METDNNENNGKSTASLRNLEELALQAHLGEYQSLIARNTSATHWQWMLLPAIGVFFMVLTNTWRLVPDEQHWLLAWGFVLTWEILTLIANTLTWGQYQKVLYIETQLRPRVERILKTAPRGIADHSFWGYEPFLVTDRGHRLIWWEWLSSVLAAVVIGVVATVRIVGQIFQWPWDWIGLSISVGILVWLLWVAWRTERLRDRWTRSLRGTAANRTI